MVIFAQERKRKREMESDEIEAASKAGTNIRNDKNNVIDYDEDRVRRLELIGCVQCWDHLREKSTRKRKLSLYV